MEVYGEWDIIVTCSYSVNVNTGKIASYNHPKISIDDIYSSLKYDLNALHLDVKKTQATKADDFHIKLDIQYSVYASYYYGDSPTATFSRYKYNKMIN